MKETVDTYQNLYQIRNVTEIILPDNHMDRFEKLRFNMVNTVKKQADEKATRTAHAHACTLTKRERDICSVQKKTGFGPNRFVLFFYCCADALVVVVVVGNVELQLSNELLFVIA